MQILSNISRSKRNQTMKFRQLIKYIMRNIFLFFWRQLQTSFAFKKVLIASGQHLSFNTTNCIKFQTINPEICSILIFQKWVQEQFLHLTLYMQGLIQKIRAASNTGQKGHFLKKKGHQKFHQPLFNPFSKCFASK